MAVLRIRHLSGPGRPLERSRRTAPLHLIHTAVVSVKIRRGIDLCRDDCWGDRQTYITTMKVIMSGQQRPNQSTHGSAREQRKVANMSTAHASTPIQVHERGATDAPLAVLIHSTGITGAEMVDRFGLAVPGYHVLAPDRTNYGQSRRSSPGGSGRSNGQVREVAMIADDAKEIGASLGRGAHLVGYSYGGVIALTIASQQRGLVRSLTLLEPPAFQLLPDDPDAVSTLVRISSAIDAVYDDPSDYFAAFMSSTFGETFRVPLDLIPNERKVASMREQVPWDVELDLDLIAAAQIPTLVVCGDWDPGFVAVSRHLAKALSGRVIEYADTSHFFDTRWNAIANELERFWRTVDEQ
jgi:pimeloyl-ACP methyl ester carboxylesterase